MQASIRRHKTGIIVGGALVLLLFFLRLVETGALINLLKGINWSYLVIAAPVLLIGYLLLTVRLRYILFNKTGWWETFYAVSIGYMLHIAMFAPALIARVAILGWVTPATLPQASSAILVERLLDMTMRVVAGLLVAILVTRMETSTEVAVGGGGFLVLSLFGAIFMVMHHREGIVNKLTQRLGKVKYLKEEQVRSTATSMLQGLEAVSSAGRLIISLLLSFAAWTIFFIFQYLVLIALPLELPVDQMLLITAVVLTVMPPSVNVMLIVYQVTIIIVLVVFNLTDTTTAAVYAITLHLIQMICWLILGRWSVRQTGFSVSQLIQSVKEYAKIKQTTPAKNKQT